MTLYGYICSKLKIINSIYCSVMYKKDKKVPTPAPAVPPATRMPFWCWIAAAAIMPPDG